MLEFIISDYLLFIVAAIVLLLGLFGYMMDKKKYKQYREEIVNEQRALETIEYQPDIQNVATPVLLNNESQNPTTIETPNIQEQVTTVEVENGNEVPEVGQN